MALQLGTARWLAPASFVIDFAAQMYGIFSTPNMLDIHEKNISFFSPQPQFIGAFFAPQQVIQLIWLYKLWTLDPKKSEKTRLELNGIVDYVPYYSVGNICIASWMLFWNSDRLDLSFIPVIINTSAQLYYVFTKLPPMDTKSTASILTHIVSKTFAGIGILDVLHNGAAAFAVNEPAPLLAKILTGAFFIPVAAMSDWILGGCLVYDLVALTVGQSGSWGTLLGIYAGVCAGLVGLKNWARPPYRREDVDYGLVEDRSPDGLV